MKSHRQLSLLALLVSVGILGCKKETPKVEAPPAQETAQAPPATPVVQQDVKQAIDTLHSSAQAKNYAEVSRSMDSVLRQPTLTQQQKDSIRVVYQRINQAVAADPSLDTKEMFELRAKMTKALTSGPRF